MALAGGMLDHAASDAVELPAAHLEAAIRVLADPTQIVRTE
jgi:hypothetical protein